MNVCWQLITNRVLGIHADLGDERHKLCGCRFYPDLHWYVDVMLTLIERAAEFATRDIWHSVIQLITNYQELHQYAAQKVGPASPQHAD